MPYRNALERRIAGMVNVLEEKEKSSSETGPSLIFDSRRSVCVRIMWTCLLFISTCTFIYQTYDRLNYYMEYPIQVDEQIEVVTKVTFPKFTICSEDTEAMKEFLQKSDIKIHICFFMMLDLFKSKGFNLTAAWDAVNTANSVTRAEFSNDQVKTQRGAILSPYGNCTSYSSDEAIVYEGENTAFYIDIAKPPDTCPIGAVRIALQPADEPLDYQSSVVLTPGYRRNMGLAIRKYKFVDRPKSPCVENKEDFYKCMEKCRNEMYMEMKCRYLFIPHNIKLPICNTSADLMNDFYKSHSIFMGFTASPLTCGCTQTCEQIFYDVFVTPEEITGNTSYFRFFYRNNYVTITSERLVYDMVALCADTGGNLGLCLGWSLLDIVYWIVYLCDFRRRAKGVSPAFKQNDPILNIVRKTWQRVRQRKQNIYNFSATVLFKRHGLAVICITFASYMAFTRVAYYFSYPMKTELTIHNQDIVQYPVITACRKSKVINNRLNYVARKKKLPNSCDLTLIDLMDPVIKLPVEKIWELSTLKRSDMVPFEGKMKNISISNINLPFGNCISVYAEPASQAETFYKYILGQLSAFGTDSICSKNMEIIVTVPHETISPLLYELIPENTLTTFRFTMKVIHLMEDSKNPNATLELETCKETCITNWINERLSCKMPYINADKLPACNSSSAAKKTKAIYLEAFIVVRPVEDCGCSPSRRYDIYEHRINIDNKNVGASLIVFFFGNTRVEHYSKVTSYTISKLISEVGGNLSAVLSLSLISIMQLLFKCYQAVFKRK